MFIQKFKFKTGLPLFSHRFSFKLEAFLLKNSSIFLKIDESLISANNKSYDDAILVRENSIIRKDITSETYDKLKREVKIDDLQNKLIVVPNKESSNVSELNRFLHKNVSELMKKYGSQVEVLNDKEIIKRNSINLGSSITDKFIEKNSSRLVGRLKQFEGIIKEEIKQIHVMHFAKKGVYINTVSVLDNVKKEMVIVSPVKLEKTISTVDIDTNEILVKPNSELILSIEDKILQNKLHTIQLMQTANGTKSNSTLLMVDFKSVESSKLNVTSITSINKSKFIRRPRMEKGGYNYNGLGRFNPYKDTESIEITLYYNDIQLDTLLYKNIDSVERSKTLAKKAIVLIMEEMRTSYLTKNASGVILSKVMNPKILGKGVMNELQMNNQPIFIKFNGSKNIIMDTSESNLNKYNKISIADLGDSYIHGLNRDKDYGLSKPVDFDHSLTAISLAGLSLPSELNFGKGISTRKMHIDSNILNFLIKDSKKNISRTKHTEFLSRTYNATKLIAKYEQRDYSTVLSRRDIYFTDPSKFIIDYDAVQIQNMMTDFYMNKKDYNHRPLDKSLHEKSVFKVNKRDISMQNQLKYIERLGMNDLTYRNHLHYSETYEKSAYQTVKEHFNFKRYQKFGSTHKDPFFVDKISNKDIDFFYSKPLGTMRMTDVLVSDNKFILPFEPKKITDHITTGLIPYKSNLIASNLELASLMNISVPEITTNLELTSLKMERDHQLSKFNYEEQIQFLTLNKRWWFIRPSDPKIRINIPEIDYPYETRPIMDVREHPIKEFKNLGTEDIDISLEILLELINIVLHWWDHSYNELMVGFGDETILGMMSVLNRWYNLDSSQEEIAEKESDSDYKRVFRWLRWESEKVYFIFKTDSENNQLFNGNHYMEILATSLLDYIEFHYYAKVPLYGSLKRMDIMRSILGDDPQGDIMITAPDKIMGDRDYIIDEENNNSLL